MNQNSRKSNNFRLLIPASEIASTGNRCIKLCGDSWILAEYERISDAPAYTCISYSWGKGRAANMFEERQTMSDRTVPALETTVKVSRLHECWKNAFAGLFRNENTQAEKVSVAQKASRAVWIDALCVPYEQPARETCLRNMGAIYSAASQVVAVLPATCAPILRKIFNREKSELDDLIAVEADDWITRAWTYQEIANGNNIFFVAEGNGDVLVSHIDFLNGLVTATTDYADAQGIERNKLAVKFPRLDSLQELFAEQQIVEHTGRSVYQVMSSMQNRYAEMEDDCIYAMIGVVSDQPLTGQNSESASAAEYFRQVSEDKGDYSFIFTIEPRSEIPGRKWRPTGEQITPVVSGLLASGTGLSGCQKSTHLQMDNMCSMSPGRINPVVSAIGNFLGRNFPGEILEQLRQKGFTGCGAFLMLEYGYFFPQLPLPSIDNIFVSISNDVVFTQGAPALLLRSNGTDINEFCDTGVFIGRCPEKSESINVY